MKTVKFIKIAMLSAITSLSVAVATAVESDPSDLELIQAAESLAYKNQEELIEAINQWDDFSQVGAILGGIAREIIKGEIVNQFVEKTKNVAESAKREYDTYKSERHERSERVRTERVERTERQERAERAFSERNTA